MKKYCITLIISVLALFINIAPCHAIKIGLEENIKQTYVGTSKAGQIVDGRSKKPLYYTKALVPYTIKAHNDTLVIKINGKYYNLGTNFIIIQNKEPKGFLATKKRWYRGEIVIYNYHKKLIVVNNVALEEYLMGVVPAEMPPGWNVEAHKAQAIAARSYAIANLGKRKSMGYDLKDTPQDQTYGGASAETKRTTKAVLETRGIVLTHDGKIIPAYYHASSGGKTVGSGAVWAKDLPYIKSVPGYDDGIRKNGHAVGMSQHGANNLANKGYNAYQILNYFYKNVKFSVTKNQY